MRLMDVALCIEGYCFNLWAVKEHRKCDVYEVFHVFYSRNM
jgi:hypothetical protein